MRKTALTAYGKVGTDWVRVTLARLESGAYAFVRADGTNSIVPVLPHTFRTSGDIANVVAQLGKRVNFSAVPSVGLPNHEWKGEYDLTEIATKFGIAAEIVSSVISSYAEEEAIAA